MYLICLSFSHLNLCQCMYLVCGMEAFSILASSVFLCRLDLCSSCGEVEFPALPCGAFRPAPSDGTRAGEVTGATMTAGQPVRPEL
eukprot:COSAG06_NODE_2145_length_7480_cov_48.475274_3_plen_86_part_00